MPGPRIALIHALLDSLEPSWKAFAELWPEAQLVNLMDDSLSRDLAAEGGKITPAINSRIIDLGRYAYAGGAKGVLYTCSGFGQSISAAGLLLPVPVLRPNEAAVEAMLDAGPRLAVLATFEPTAMMVRGEIAAAAKARNLSPTIEIGHVPGALAALQSGRAEEHDALIAAAAAALPPVDAVMLAQFSMARAAAAIAPAVGRTVYTTPSSAVLKMKSRLAP